MERALHWLISFTILTLGLSLEVRADIVLAPSPSDIPPAKIKAADFYPASSFGKPPQDVMVRRGGRSPASEMLEGDALAVSQAQKVRAGKKGVVPNGQKGIQEVAVIAGDLGYFPKTVFVSKDIPVRIFVTGAAKSTLCIMMDEFNVRKQIRPKEIQEINFTPTFPGKYRFYCPVNGIEGTMVVRES